MAQKISGSNDNDYIPTRDAELYLWGENFSALLTADPTAYGLTAPQAADIQAAYDSFAANYDAAVNPITRTSPQVSQKNVARTIFTALARTFGQYIKAEPTVTNAQILNLGLHVNDPTPTPIVAPVTYPMLQIAGLSPGRILLRANDSDQAGQRAKPFGASALELWYCVGDEPAASPATAKFLRLHTRQPIDQTLPAEDAGKIGTFFGRWVTARGLTGPWSAGTSSHLV